MYTIDHIFLVLPIKYLINKDVDPTTPYKLATGTKPSVSHLHLLFCTCILRKSTAHIGTKALNMCHQSQNVFMVSLLEFHSIKSPVYVQGKRKIISSYDVVFYKNFSSVLVYTSLPYSEAMAMRLAVMYTSCAQYLMEQTGDIITFTQFEEGYILTKTCNDAEIGEQSDDNSIMPPLLSKEEIDAMDSGDESDHDIISTEMLEYIHDGSQSRPNVN